MGQNMNATVDVVLRRLRLTLLFDLFQTQGIRRVTSPAPLQASLSLFASMCVFLGRADCVVIMKREKNLGFVSWI
ncbi:unnamed protein product [Brassica rapa subsp. trilocularis]